MNPSDYFRCMIFFFLKWIVQCQVIGYAHLWLALPDQQMSHAQGSVCPTRHFRAAGSRASESELLLTCPTPSRRTVANPGQSKCTDWHLWFNVYVVFTSTKVANIGQQGKRVLLFICIWLY